MWVTLPLILLLIAIFCYFNTKKPDNFPPGPRWLPLIGCALTIQQYRKRHRTLAMGITQMSKDYSDGQIVGLKVGNEMQVIVSSLQAYKEFAANSLLDGRPTGPLYTLKSWGLSRGILLVDGELWQEQRRFLVHHLSNFGFGKSTTEHMITQEVNSLIKFFKREIQKSPTKVATLDMQNAFATPLLNLVWYFLAGVRYEPDDMEMQEIQTIMEDLFSSMDRTGALFHHFPILQYLAPEKSGYNKYMRALEKGWAFLQKEIDAHKETYDENVTRDFMDVFLTQMKNGPDKESSFFTERQLIALCMDMFIAGSHTSSKSLSFAFLYFLRQPQVALKAQRQIDHVVGRDRMPTLADRPHLPYIEACVCEGIRIFSGHGFSIPHRALDGTTLLGYNIPKNTSVVFNHNGLQMNEKIWENPWQFKPERFLDVDGKFIISPNFQPFGLGRHYCIGSLLGRSSLFVFISCLLHTFNFTNPRDSCIPDDFPIEGVFTNTQPFKSEISLRSE